MVSGIGLLPLVAGLRRAELGGGVEQGHLDPLGALALPERDGEAPRDPGLDLAHGRHLGHEAGGQLLQLGRGLVLQDEVVHGGEAVLERVARGAGLALLGDGAARAGTVAAGGLDLGGGAGAGAVRAWRASGGWRLQAAEHSMPRNMRLGLCGSGAEWTGQNGPDCEVRILW